jgi:hypothetical protein
MKASTFTSVARTTQFQREMLITKANIRFMFPRLRIVAQITLLRRLQAMAKAMAR